MIKRLLALKKAIDYSSINNLDNSVVNETPYQMINEVIKGYVELKEKLVAAEAKLEILENRKEKNDKNRN